MRRRHFLLWIGSMAGLVACRAAWNHGILLGFRFWFLASLCVSGFVLSCALVAANERVKSIRQRGFQVLPMNKNNRSGFTLIEMLVVMAIIILFVTLAIPAISAITGTRSISAAENQISAVLARAREEAIGIQDYRGVLFYIDPREDRVVAALVRSADLQGDAKTNPTGALLLDAVENRDYLMMPQGIRLHTLYDDPNCRYLGFNPVPASTENVRFGGVILFDGQGRLVSKPYGFKWKSPDPTNPSNTIDSGIAALMKVVGDNFVPTNGSPNNPLRSQLGLILFDYAPFKSQSFTDGDPSLDPNADYTSEKTEEDWLDTNSTPVLINRFSGTLIKSE
jgi:prepilin-type N-terminal cleavage/methylation domain-containing protein